MTEYDTTTEESDDAMIDAQTGAHYTYLGLDADGFHHHYNEEVQTVFVTQEDAEIDRSGAVPRYTIRGEVDRIEEDVAGHELEAWGEFVADNRGWEEFALKTVSMAGIGDHFNTRREAI